MAHDKPGEKDETARRFRVVEGEGAPAPREHFSGPVTVARLRAEYAAKMAERDAAYVTAMMCGAVPNRDASDAYEAARTARKAAFAAAHGYRSFNDILGDGLLDAFKESEKAHREAFWEPYEARAAASAVAQAAESALEQAIVEAESLRQRLAALETIERDLLLAEAALAADLEVFRSARMQLEAQLTLPDEEELLAASEPFQLARALLRFGRGPRAPSPIEAATLSAGPMFAYVDALRETNLKLDDPAVHALVTSIQRISEEREAIAELREERERLVA